MPSLTDTRALRAEQSALWALAEGDLRSIWADAAGAAPRATRDRLLRQVPQVTTVYGNAGATIAADWYDDIRLADAVPGKYRATPMPNFPEGFVRKRLRYGAGHIFTDTPNMFLPFLLNAMQEYVMQPGRDTVTVSSVNDPFSSGWQRITDIDACDFCVMLAARGGVYKKDTVSFGAHGDCNCTAIPSWDMDAEEVDVDTYKASDRAFRKDPDQLRRHNAALRDYLT